MTQADKLTKQFIGRKRSFFVIILTVYAICHSCHPVLLSLFAYFSLSVRWSIFNVQFGSFSLSCHLKLYVCFHELHIWMSLCSSILQKGTAWEGRRKDVRCLIVFCPSSSLSLSSLSSHSHLSTFLFLLPSLSLSPVFLWQLLSMKVHCLTSLLSNQTLPPAASVVNSFENNLFIVFHGWGE